MKRLSKILALVLAMTMMFGVVSICASAADTTNAAFKVEFVDNDGNAITSVTAGNTANVIVSIKTNGYSPIFAFLAFYDYTALTHIRQNGTAVQTLSAKNCGELLGRFGNDGNYEEASDELLAHEDDVAGNGYVNDWGFTGNVTMTPHKDLMWDGIGFTDAQKAQYKGINFGYLVGVTDSNLTVNTEGEYYQMVRFRFLAEKDTTLDQNAFFLLDNDTKTYITIDPDDEPLRNAQASTPVKASNLTVEYATGGSTPEPTPTVTVENLDTQVQWQDKDAGLMRVAFRGNIKGYDATTDLVTGSTTELNKLTEIGVMFSKTDSTPTKEEGATVVPAYTIYDFTTGGYFYRAVVGSVDYTSTETLYANAYIVLNGTTYTATNAVISTTGAAEYTRATGNGMAAK